jgi:hypothetical protein
MLETNCGAGREVTFADPGRAYRAIRLRQNETWSSLNIPAPLSDRMPATNNAPSTVRRDAGERS